MKKKLNLALFVIFVCALNVNAEQTINCGELSMLPVVGEGGTMNTTMNGIDYEITNENGYVTHKENGELKYTYNVSEDLGTKTNCVEY